MVGAGVFESESTRHRMSSVIPKGATWIKARVASFQPEQDQVTTDHGRAIRYRALIVAPGNMLVWDSIDGLSSEARRVGQECVSTCRSRWSQDHSIKQQGGSQ